MDEPEIRVTYLVGHAPFVEPTYSVRCEESGPRWWRRKRYWIDSELMRLGPFKTEAQANEVLGHFPGSRRY